MSFLGKQGRNWSAVAFVVVMFLALSGALMLGYQKSVSGSAVQVASASLPAHNSSVFSEAAGVVLLLLVLSGMLLTVMSSVWHHVRKGSEVSNSLNGSGVALDDLGKLNSQIEELNKSIREVDRKL